MEENFDSKLWENIKEMFPTAPEKFHRAMYHNIKGKQFLWDAWVNDDSK